MKKDNRQAYKDVMSYEYKRGFKAGRKSLETAITKAYKEGYEKGCEDTDYNEAEAKEMEEYG